MMIAIKDMKMPTECEYCGFCRYYPENGNVWCNANNRILKLHWKEPDWTHLDVKRPDWCPLIEIKTDGDTISRQAALDALEWKYAGKAAFDAIKALPSAHPEIKTDGDAISRHAAIDVMFNFHKGHGRRYAEIDLEEFDALPSVHPEPMTARIEPLQTTTIHESGETFTAGCLSAWVCDNCKAIYSTKPSTKRPDFDFCPKCGARFLKDGEE